MVVRKEMNRDADPCPPYVKHEEKMLRLIPKGAEEMAAKKMSRVDAGKKGGNATKKKHGVEHFIKIGKEGGKIGGATTKERYGLEFYREIGRKGGLK